MTFSFKSQEDLLTALPGVIYSFEGATLKASTPLPGTNNKQVATTDWVSSLLGIAPAPPIVMVADGLNITYTSGTVYNPSTNNPIEITGITSPLALNANSTEYIWVRYLDDAVIASTNSPSNNQGYLLATVTTNTTDVISIVANTNVVGWAPINSPSFAGVVTVPTPGLTDNSNKVPTTSWVRSMVQTTLAGSSFPILSISNPGNGVLWSDGSVILSGTNYPVMGGQYTFTPTTSGLIHIYAVVVGNTTVVSVSPTTPGGDSVLLGSVTVSNGEVVQVGLPPTSGFALTDSPRFTGNPQAPTPPLSDNGSSIATTEWVVDMVSTKMVVGFGGYVTYS